MLVLDLKDETNINISNQKNTWYTYFLNSHQKIRREWLKKGTPLKKSGETHLKIKPIMWPIACFHDHLVSLDYNYQNLLNFLDCLFLFKFVIAVGFKKQAFTNYHEKARKVKDVG